MKNDIRIREMIDGDVEIISNAFLKQDWNKPASQYVQYFQESLEGKRTILVADYDGEFAGYVTIVWKSDYPPFQAHGIPEIVDFNVLVKYQRRGISNTLMETAEHYVAKCTDIVGIGVGLTTDYGAAQILYVKRGYIPDGLGVFQQGRYLKYGEQVQVDDDVTLYFTKRLNSVEK